MTSPPLWRGGRDREGTCKVQDVAGRLVPPLPVLCSRVVCVWLVWMLFLATRDVVVFRPWAFRCSVPAVVMYWRVAVLLSSADGRQDACRCWPPLSTPPLLPAALVPRPSAAARCAPTLCPHPARSAAALLAELSVGCTGGCCPAARAPDMWRQSPVSRCAVREHRNAPPLQSQLWAASGRHSCALRRHTAHGPVGAPNECLNPLNHPLLFSSPGQSRTLVLPPHSRRPARRPVPPHCCSRRARTVVSCTAAGLFAESDLDGAGSP
jgi:hypothetical protein